MWFALLLGVCSGMWILYWNERQWVPMKNHLVELSKFRMELWKDLSNVSLSEQCDDWIVLTKSRLVQYQRPSVRRVVEQSMEETGLACLISKATIEALKDEPESDHWDLSDYLNTF